MSQTLRWWSALSLIAMSGSGCVTLRSGEGFSHAGTQVKCLNDIPEEHASVVRESAELGIDVLQDEVFQTRALAALRDAQTHASCRNEHIVSALTAEQKLARLQAATTVGFSLKTRNSWWPWSKTNAWEGVDDPVCGRVVALNRRKLGSRPTYLWAGTIVHEVSHVGGFGHHLRNERDGNECTIPNVLGDLAEWRAWELQQASSGDKQPYLISQTVCASVATLCRQSGPESPCVVKNEVTNQKPWCER